MTISSFHPVTGGGEVQARDLARVLVSRGHKVTVLTRLLDPGQAAEESIGGIRIVRLPGNNHWAFVFHAVRWIIRNRHGISLVHAHQSLSPLVAGVIASRLTSIPVVCTPMTGRPELNWVSSKSGALRRVLFGTTALWIAKSGEIALLLGEFAPGRVVRIPNGVDTARFAPEPVRREGEVLPRRTAIFVGRLEPPKRVDTLLKAWRAAPHGSRLLIVGEGSLRRAWEDLARTERLECVEFLGLRSDIPRLLRESDIFVLSSDREGMPNALLEAMSCGLCCIASHVGAIPEMLGDGVGIAVTPGDVSALGDALSKALSDRSLSQELGQRARRRVVEHYSIESVVSHVESAYMRILGGRVRDVWSSWPSSLEAPRGNRGNRE
jgi:glycosyltransferase involved in cell wall biosynthesis